MFSYIHILGTPNKIDLAQKYLNCTKQVEFGLRAPRRGPHIVRGNLNLKNFKPHKSI